VSVQAVLELLGAVEEDALFRLCDLVVDHDTAGALTFVEELASQGQDLARLVTDLLEHLRHLLLVQHMGGAPDSLPVTEETRERLRAQANQLGPAEVLRLIDLLAVAVDDIRQGGDPRLPLEIALVKVTRPQADLSRESLLLRLEQLETRLGREHVSALPDQPVAHAQPEPEADEQAENVLPLELEQIQHLWKQAVLPALEERSIPTASMLREATPVELAGSRLVIEFPPSASFHRNLAEEPRNAGLLAEVLHEVTGHHLKLAFAVGAAEREGDEGEPEPPTTEEELVSLLKNTFDASEVREES
jgi:DNA polymerase-3 subunit gamma/tau